MTRRRGNDSAPRRRVIASRVVASHRNRVDDQRHNTLVSGAPKRLEVAARRRGSTRNDDTSALWRANRVARARARRAAHAAPLAVCAAGAPTLPPVASELMKMGELKGCLRTGGDLRETLIQWRPPPQKITSSVKKAHARPGSGPRWQRRPRPTARSATAPSTAPSPARCARRPSAAPASRSGSARCERRRSPSPAR